MKKKTLSQRNRQVKRIAEKKTLKARKAVMKQALSTKEKLAKAVEIRDKKGLISARIFLRDNGYKAWDRFY